MPRRLAKIDFSDAGGTHATATVLAPDVVAGSLPRAWLFPKATDDHSVDEHVLAPIRVLAGEPTAGVSIPIYAVLDHTADAAGKAPLVTGQWFVAIDY